MASNSDIEWTDSTWNPVTGCTAVSAGCDNCYAAALAKRLQAMGSPRYRNGFKVALQPDLVDLPLRWKKPRKIFVNSMSDLYHKEVPDSYIRQIFNTMAQAEWHQFQILTKRPQRLARLAPTLRWPNNVWQGVSIENNEVVWRADYLRRVPAAVRFLSLEPLIGPVDDLDYTGIDWVIVGGESGRRARPVQKEWIIPIFRACRQKQIPFFFKQWGGPTHSASGRTLNRRTYDEFPTPHGRMGLQASATPPLVIA